MRTSRHGFTLIELLIVVVVIGILASTAIQEFRAAKRNAYLTAVKHDLKNLAVAQESYAASNAGAYFSHTYTTPTDSSNNYGPSLGVSMTVVTGGTAGWSATATHVGAPNHTCAIFVGTAPVPPATDNGSPACN